MPCSRNRRNSLSMSRMLIHYDSLSFFSCLVVASYSRSETQWHVKTPSTHARQNEARTSALKKGGITRTAFGTRRFQLIAVLQK